MLLLYEQVRAKGVNLSKSQLGRLERDGKFPLRVNLTATRRAWIEDEVDAWLESRIKAQRGPVQSNASRAAVRARQARVTA